MFKVPNRGMSRNFCGRKFPYAAVTHKSKFIFTSVSKNSGSFAFTGFNSLDSSKPLSIASCVTGDGGGGPDDFLPRPLGRPGCDITAATSNKPFEFIDASCNRPKTFAATSGVPKNATLFGLLSAVAVVVVFAAAVLVVVVVVVVVDDTVLVASVPFILIVRCVTLVPYVAAADACEVETFELEGTNRHRE